MAMMAVMLAFVLAMGMAVGMGRFAAVVDIMVVVTRTRARPGMVLARFFSQKVTQQAARGCTPERRQCVTLREHCARRCTYPGTDDGVRSLVTCICGIHRRQGKRHGDGDAADQPGPGHVHAPNECNGPRLPGAAARVQSARSQLK